jgi:hypothetical protein
MTSLPARQRRAATWIVLGVVAALAVVATVLAINLLSNLPTGIDATATASSRASASQTPSAPPQPSASVSEAAGPRLMQVTVDALRMRAAANTSADVIRTFDLGEVVRVVSGPIEADGFAWYEVVDLDSRSGWSAMGDGGAPWLEPVPRDPATSELLLRYQRDCDVSPRTDGGGIPVWPPDLSLTADGRVVWNWSSPLVIRQLSPSGLAQIQNDVLDLPVLQESADYLLERLPNTPDPLGHGVCISTFKLGEGTGQVVVTAVAWQGAEEGVYWVPSPERRVLDELAIHLSGAEVWLGAAAWSEPVARGYASGSYLFWLEPPSNAFEEGVDAPLVTGAAWPFDGPIEQFGEPAGQARCGYLDLGQAFETLRLMRERGVPTQIVGTTSPRQLSLDSVGYGTFATRAGWFSFWLTPRSPDGYPNCA